MTTKIEKSVSTSLAVEEELAQPRESFARERKARLEAESIAEKTTRELYERLQDFSEEKARLADTQRAILNILDDAAGEKTTLDNVQRATLNILEDFDGEKQRLEQVQRASLNILEDFGDERRRLEGVQRAAINILEDFDEEKRMLQGVQRAMLNILEDIDVEKAKVGTVNQQLETANKELEAFSYSVSHDLRAPLRSIDGFSLALLEDYADKLDAQGKNHLERVRAASQHMAQLIDDMLNLSRVTRSEMRRETIHLSAMAREIAAGLRKTQPERQVGFTIAENVTATGDERLIGVVMQNLLGNAWKYTGKHGRARIEFGVKDEDGKPVFYIRDDGAGFNIAYADKLFGVFQRLHRRGEFPGTGVGLATVQRIIHRHGGRVWAEGAVEKGATFYFTLGDTFSHQLSASSDATAETA